MEQRRDSPAQSLGERLSYQRVAGVYRPDEGALSENLCDFLDRGRVGRMLSEIPGMAMQHQMCSCVQFILGYGFRTHGPACVQEGNAIVHLAEPSLLLGVKIKWVPPDSDNLRQLLGKHDLLA